jgi:hypothetical protein
MTAPSTAREALIAEALGDVTRLLDRVETLLPAMEASRKTLDKASAGFAQRAAAFEARVVAMLEDGKSKTVQHILGEIEEARRLSFAHQKLAMTESARTIFSHEFGTTWSRIATAIKALAERIERVERIASTEPQGGPWVDWLTHLATAAVSSAVTWVLMGYLQRH